MAITPERFKIDMYLLLDTNRKLYMGNPTAPLDVTLSNLERSNSRSHIFRSHISGKGAQLGSMLLLNINRKPYMGSLIALSHLTLSDLERSKSRSVRLRSLMFRRLVRPYVTIKH